jgi:signal transduction histidine kinase
MNNISPSSSAAGDRPQLLQEVARLQLLRQIAILTANIRDRGQLLSNALQQLQEFYKLSGCGIYQIQDSVAPLNLVSSLGISKKLVLELQRVPPGKGLIAQVVKSGLPHSWVDLRDATELYCQAILADHWRSLLAHPLLAHDRLIGVLLLFDRQPRQFDQPDIELIGHCCQLLAAAIDSSELVEKLEWQHRLTHASQRELGRSRQQLREHVTRLEETNHSLEQANQMKDRFLALASHELRTPLTWILTATEMLESQLDELPPESRSLLSTIFKGGRRLNALVEDLLEMARIEARDIYLARENIDLPLLLGELALQYGDESLRRQLTLEIGQIPDHLSPIGDHHHLRQALERILKNALKFTPPGGFVRMEARHCTAEELLRQRAQMEPFCPDFFRRTPLRDHLNISITDSGVGISEQDRLQIFDKFHGAGDISLHGKNQHSVQGPSVGLGLPLAKGMIEAHGGMIWVESRSDSASGSRFHVLLPLYQPHRQHDS